jgi:hypothetical protein
MGVPHFASKGSALSKNRIYFEQGRPIAHATDVTPAMRGRFKSKSWFFF